MTSTDQHRAARIRTPDQRLRVFVSSTLAELAPERAAVARAISALGLTPVMFELGARPHPPQELYRAYLAQSDVFVGLYWQRYGWVGPGMAISGLEDEFRLSDGMPRLLYLKTPAPEQEPRLAAMIADLQATGADSYRSFRGTRDLARLVRNDLALLLSERFAAPAAAARSAMATEPGAGPAPPRRSLPTPPTSLIGRAQDVAQLTTLLGSPDVRLVTLTGPGGIGKTRLAIAVGAALERAGRDTGFIPLATVTDPTAVLPRIADALGVSIEGTRSPLDTLIDHFARTPAVLILDNLEQVAGVAPELDQLLATCPQVTILATSRTALRLRAEREHPVGPLEVPASPDQLPVEQVAALPAVALFVDRARAVRHDFTLDDTNAAAIAEICRRLDGLPLALELAAARTRVLAPSALLGRLGHVLDALGAGPVDLPERQRTLRATVQWSFDLLAGPERQFLDALSVFAGGWTIDAAAHVAATSDDDALDRLDTLAAHSLVTVEAGDSVPRFTMLATVRELAAERLAASGTGFDVGRRHAEHYAALVTDVDPSGDRQVEWADRLAREEDNLRAAIGWFLDHDTAPLPHLFRSLWLFWQLRDRMREARTWIDELGPATAALDGRARAEVLFTTAVTAVEVGDDAAALAAVDAIDALGAPADDPQLASMLQLAVAWTRPIRDDLEGALQAATVALEGLVRRDDPWVAFAELTVGMLQMATGPADDARQHLERVDDLGARYGNAWLQASARTQLASLASSRGDPRLARALLDRAVDAIGATHPSTLTLTLALVTAAQLALVDGEPHTAATALGAAQALRTRAGLTPWPLSRHRERRLSALVGDACGPAAYEVAFTAGTGLDVGAALALVAGGHR